MARVGDDAANAAEIVRKDGAQGLDTADVAVREGGVAHARERMAQGAQPGGARKPGDIRDARAEVEAGHRCRSDRSTCRLGDERRGLGHPRPGPLSQAQVALGGELSVCIDNDPARHADLAGEIARRRHARAGVQGAVADRPPQLPSICAPSVAGVSRLTESRSSIG